MQRTWLRAGKIDKYETAERVSGSGRPRTACMADNVATVEKLWASGGSVYALAFVLEVDISSIWLKMMWLTTSLTIF